MHGRQRGPGRSALSSAVKSAVASVGKRPKNDAGVFIDGMPKIHGEGENNDKEEEIEDIPNAYEWHRLQKRPFVLFLSKKLLGTNA